MAQLSCPISGWAFAHVLQLMLHSDQFTFCLFQDDGDYIIGPTPWFSGKVE
jgi:hypothetical protein